MDKSGLNECGPKARCNKCSPISAARFVNPLKMPFALFPARQLWNPDRIHCAQGEHPDQSCWFPSFSGGGRFRMKSGVPHPINRTQGKLIADERRFFLQAGKLPCPQRRPRATRTRGEFACVRPAGQRQNLGAARRISSSARSAPVERPSRGVTAH